MSFTEFFCLSVSRSGQGFYVSGIDLEANKWVRVVANKYGAPLSFGQMRIDSEISGRRIRPLDVVSLPIGVSAPMNVHPENMVINQDSNSKSVSLLRNAAENQTLIKMIHRLAEISTQEETLFGSNSSEITSNVKALQSSLHVVYSQHLYWKKTDEFNKGRDHRDFGCGPTIKGRFDFGAFSDRFCLPLSDISWEFKIRGKIPEDHFISHSDLLNSIDAGNQIDTFMTLSFDDDFILGANAKYKFIAGILLLPKQVHVN